MDEEVEGGLTADEQALLDADQAAGNENTDVVETGDQDDAGTGAAAQPGADKAGADGANKGTPKMVRLEALQEERAERKRLADELKAEREQRRILDERTNKILERFGQPQPAATAAPAEEKIPSLEDDPVGHIIGSLKAVNKQLGDINAGNQKQQETTRQATAISELQNRARTAETAYMKDNPDYPEASTFLQTARDEELQMLGYTDPLQRQAFIAQEALGIAAQALRAGKNPAAVVHELAKKRGFTPKKAPAPAADGATDAVAKVENIRGGQAQNRSLSNARGSAPVPLTVESLLKMSEAEFDRALQTPEGRALMGA